MPKNRLMIKNQQGVTYVNVAHKHLIGSRKSGKTAHSMPNSELLAIIDNKDQTRDAPTARIVLRKRGVQV